MYVKPLPFTHEGKNYEVRAQYEDGRWTVRVFDGDEPKPTPLTVTDEIVADASAMGHPNLLSEAMEIVRDDFKRGQVYEVELAIRELNLPKKKA